MRRISRLSRTACSCFRIRAHLGRGRVVGRELQERLVRRDHGRRVVRRLRGLGELELDASDPSAGRGDLAVLLDRLRRRGLDLRDCCRDLLVVGRAHGVRDRVGRERAAADLEDRVANRRRERSSRSAPGRSARAPARSMPAAGRGRRALGARPYPSAGAR